MDRIWAPWRKAYIRPKGSKEKGCLFCRLVKSSQDTRHYLVKRSPASFAVLNLYPYNNGHVMIVPRRHASSVRDLTDREKLDWLALYEEILSALKKGLKPHGFNVGINLGRAAGAGVPGHLYLHVVPRWKGDSNFMPILAGTKVISESLDSVFATLKKTLQKSSPRKRRR